MPLSEAKRAANKKWDAANMQNLSVKVRRDYAERIKAAAAAAGTTPSSIMRRALDDFMREHDK
jgi:predicted transcriptional regulator